MKDQKIVFGLSIAETMEWGIAEANSGFIIRELARGAFDEIVDSPVPVKLNEPGIPIEAQLGKAINALAQNKRDLFSRVAGIGVSTIGLVNKETKVLEYVARKNWTAPLGSVHLIDFKRLFLPSSRDQAGPFPNIDSAAKIFVQNDASARSVTEYIYGGNRTAPSKGPANFLHFIVGEGINGALVHEDRVLDTERHTELGHCFPQLHDDDIKFDPLHSGCPAHVTCFEGVASSARFRLQSETRQNLWELPPNDDAWEIEAWYMSQLVMNGVLHFNPRMVSLGGRLFTGECGTQLFEKTVRHFLKRNTHVGDDRQFYLPQYKTEQDVRALMSLARLGPSVRVAAALQMGCMAAFPPIKNQTAREAGKRYIELVHPRRENE